MLKCNREDLEYRAGDIGYIINYKGQQLCLVKKEDRRLSSRRNTKKNEQIAINTIESLVAGHQPEGCILIKKIREIEGNRLKCVTCNANLRFFPDNNGMCDTCAERHFRNLTVEVMNGS